MNGFEPLRRRVIDYTDAGQWSEVYDGPLEECESEKLKAENAKLRELLRQFVEYVQKEHLPHEDISFWSDRDNGVFRRMRELGIEVE